MKDLLQATTDLVESLNPDYQNDPDMKGTPERLQKMYQHFFRNEDIEYHFEKKFPTTNDQMVVVRNIEVIGMCPHHFVPIIYRVSIGYIPDKWAIGLSKLARIAIGLASYPKLQENYTDEIVQAIKKHLKPKGVIVVVDGVHGCMRCRGVQQSESSTITSSIDGIFMDKDTAKQEFLKLIKL
ncbi:MAG: GTP cyclohydrolase I [Gottschalkiaceae bacterium]|nr:MAG: GTP cyclohydrolase I [Gottschalkiaceae bacterium]